MSIADGTANASGRLARHRARIYPLTSIRANEWRDQITGVSSLEALLRIFPQYTEVLVGKGTLNRNLINYLSMAPHECALTWREIEERAASIADQYGFDPRKTPVSALAHDIGGGPSCIEFVSLERLEDLESGSLEVFGPGKFKILLSPITSNLRNNFTIAHELGHYFLHSGNPAGSVPIRVRRSGESTLVEQQANRFAASLLMPQEAFSKAFDATKGNIRVLSGLFTVSQPAVSVRIESLHLV